MRGVGLSGTVILWVLSWPLRARDEGLDEETLALFDLLMKPDLGQGDITKLKNVAVGLFQELTKQLDAMQDFSRKQATRDSVRVAIADYLYDDRTGRPPSYQPEEVDMKTQAIFAHILTKQAPSLYAV